MQTGPGNLTGIDWRSRARDALRLGNPEAAEGAYARVLAAEPDDPEALVFLAGQHAAAGRYAEATELLQVSLRRQPGQAAVWHQLGAIQLAAGDFDGAVASLGEALARAPRLFVARLQMGVALEQLGRGQDALVAYLTAIRLAQEAGRWLSDETTAPGLRGTVKYAMRYVNSERHILFQNMLEPLRERYGAGELARVEHCLAIYFGQTPLTYPDPRQRPKFLYFPDIPSQPYYPRERFPWLAEVEAATAAIREELLEVLSGETTLEPFHGVQSPRQVADVLRGSGAREAAWDAYFFYRHGTRYDEHCLRCPQTVTVLDRVPLVRIRDHAPETLFSVLRPGTHILPHRGVTNTRLVTHLPLVVPSDCALRVGGQLHQWQEGHCVTFDDTFEHEAWNHSGQTRAVLIFDSWNPDLTEIERAAVTDLVEALGDFNRACEVSD